MAVIMEYETAFKNKRHDHPECCHWQYNSLLEIEICAVQCGSRVTILPSFPAPREVGRCERTAATFRQHGDSLPRCAGGAVDGTAARGFCPVCRWCSGRYRQHGDSLPRCAGGAVDGTAAPRAKQRLNGPAPGTTRYRHRYRYRYRHRPAATSACEPPAATRHRPAATSAYEPPTTECCEPPTTECCEPPTTESCEPPTTESCESPTTES